MQMTVSLAGLRAVEALATHGSISAAAAALGYTPSAVSQQIIRLERDLRQDLVERQGRRAALTVAGQIIAESARRVILELETMNARLQSEMQTVTGVLTVAAFPSAARGIVPAAMSRLVGVGRTSSCGCSKLPRTTRWIWWPAAAPISRSRTIGSASR